MLFFPFFADELITVGDFSPDVRQKHLNELFGTPQKEKLCVFRYATWQFWKSKFYEWHHLWIERMRRKTEELSIDPEFTTDTAQTAALDQAVKSVSPDAAKECKNPQSAVHLPRHFVPGTVVQVSLRWRRNMFVGSDFINKLGSAR